MNESKTLWIAQEACASLLFAGTVRREEYAEILPTAQPVQPASKN